MSGDHGHQAQTKSQTRRGTFTDEQMLLVARINEAIVKDPVFGGIQMMVEMQLPREEVTKDGKSRSYFVDIALRDPKSGLRFAIEVMGEGSASDDFERHLWLIEHGFPPLYFTNGDVVHSMRWVMRRIRSTIQMMRVLFS